MWGCFGERLMAPRQTPTRPQPATAGGVALFGTLLGPCGVAWGGQGIVAIQLPEEDESATRSRLLATLRRYNWALPHADAVEPPPSVRDAMAGIQALLSGEPRDLREVALDMSHVSPFHQQVYAVTRAIAPGSTRTYGDIAQELGSLGLARAVGQALGMNPCAPVVPCHRVLAAHGKPGGFSAGGGAATKVRMLDREGALAHETLALFAPPRR
jgi:methylated-DNA-[protein]-cysteine S-methyltransferase